MITIVLDDTLEKNPRYANKYDLRPAEQYDIVHNTFKGSHPLHGFVLAVHRAFANHLELRVSPDDLWTLVVQGIAEHVSMDPEKYRSKFVDFEGKKELTVKTGSAVVWEDVIPEFNKQIIESTIKDSTVSKMVTSYSTTQPINTIVYQTAVMSTTQAYFNYRVHTMCGIRKFTLLGESADWHALIKNLDALKLDEIGLARWNAHLFNIFGFFLKLYDQPNASADDIDILKSFYKFNSGSGSCDMVSGWILKLFPYLGNMERRSNKGADLASHLKESQTFTYADGGRPSHFGYSEYVKKYGVRSDSFSTGLNKVPFKWELETMQDSVIFDMLFMAGFDIPVVNAEFVQTVYAFGVAYAKPREETDE